MSSANAHSSRALPDFYLPQEICCPGLWNDHEMKSFSCICTVLCLTAPQRNRGTGLLQADQGFCPGLDLWLRPQREAGNGVWRVDIFVRYLTRPEKNCGCWDCVQVSRVWALSVGLKKFNLSCCETDFNQRITDSWRHHSPESGRTSKNQLLSDSWSLNVLSFILRLLFFFFFSDHKIIFIFFGVSPMNENKKKIKKSYMLLRIT